MRPRRWAVVAALVVAGSCSSGTSAADEVAAAPAETVAAGTARLFQRIEVTPPSEAGGEAEASVATARGVVDFASGEGAMTVTAAGEDVEVVYRGTTIYQHLPEVAGAVGREWLRLDLDALGEAAGVEGLGDLVQAQSSDPAAALQYLKGASDEVREVGREQIRGAATTWYETTVDIEKAAAGAPAGQRATVGRIKEVFGIGRIPTEVWIDGDGRVRRLHQVLDWSDADRSGRFPAGALPERVETTLELYDFGTPVKVELPAADRVADYADVVERAERGEGSGTATPETDALVPRLLAEVPAGYEQQRDNVGDTGPSDLEKAVRDDGAPDARRVLEADGFVAGYQRLWTKAEEGTIIDFVYRFATPAGAAHYLERTLAGVTEDGGTTDVAVPGVPGARGVRIAEDDQQTTVVFLTRGGFLGQVVVIGPDATTDLPADLARQQYERFG